MTAERPSSRGMDRLPLSEAAQEHFFEQILEQAVAAERVTGACEVDIILIGQSIRLAFAGPVLRDSLLPAVAHLQTDRCEAVEAVFHVWESELSGVPIAALPFERDCITDRGDIWTLMSRRVRSCFHSADRVLSLLNLEQRRGIFWIESTGTIPAWVRAAPFLSLLHWWLEEAGAQLLCGAVVGTDEGGVLITGPEGSGTSTTALACLQNGFRFVGDEYVAVTLDPPMAHSLYRSTKIDHAMIDRIGARNLQQAELDHAEGTIVMVEPALGISPTMSLNAVLTTELSDRPSSNVTSCTPRRALNAASFTTIAQLPHAGARVIDFVERLLDQVPCGRLRLGTDFNTTADSLASFIAEPGRRPKARIGRAPPWQPLVSVIIPTFNGAAFLAEAVGSILGQEYPRLEIIVVDDGSTDHIERAIDELAIKPILLRQDNLGPSAARNKGIARANGEVIAFLDVDDLWPARRLMSGLEALASDPNLDVVTGFSQLTAYEPTSGEWVFVDDARRNFPHYIAAAIFRPAAFDKVGLFDERLRFGEDIDWFIRAREAGVQIRRLHETTLLVRRHATNITHGRSGVELLPLRLAKNIMERRRAAGTLTGSS